jgi:hypothetical protein
MEEDSTLTLDGLVCAEGEIEPLRPHELIELPIDEREICTLTIGDPGWVWHAIDELLNDSEVVIIDPDGGFIHVTHYHIRSPRRPVWGQLRRILIDAGMRVPRQRWS